MVIAMMNLIPLNVIMMVETVVDLVSTQIFAKNVYALVILPITIFIVAITLLILVLNVQIFHVVGPIVLG